MIDYMSTYDDIGLQGTWSRAEMAWAIARQLIDFDVLKQCAFERREGDPSIHALVAQLEITPLGERGNVAMQFAALDDGFNEEDVSRKWLVASLANLYANRHLTEDPLGEVERIYADFDYPESMKSFVRYMPVAGEYNPDKHSHEQNVERLFENWRRFLASE